MSLSSACDGCNYFTWPFKCLGHQDSGVNTFMSYLERDDDLICGIAREWQKLECGRRLLRKSGKLRLQLEK